MSLISGRAAVSGNLPAHIAERISDKLFDDAIAAEELKQRIAKATDAILEGDGLHTWARDDYAYELVDLVHHLYSMGATRQEIGDSAVQWLRDVAERQATREVEERS